MPIQPIADLIADLNDMIDAIIWKEVTFEMNGYKTDIGNSLYFLKLALEGFADALAANFAPEVAAIGILLTGELPSAIQRANDAYSS